MTFRDKVHNSLKRLPKRLCVEFALYCCNDIRHLISNPEPIKALGLTQKWLDTNGAGVTEEELRAAASASYAAYGAYYGASATYASYAANAANAAATVTEAATNRQSKEKQYLNHLVKTVANLSELEKVLYDIEEGI